MTPRHRRNEAVVQWVRALAQNGGSLLLNVTEVDRRRLYWLGALWGEEKGLLKRHDTVEILSHEPRRFGYTLTTKGARAARLLSA